MPPPLLDGLGRGHGPFPLDRLQPFLDSGQIGRQLVGHRLAVWRPVGRARAQAAPAERDQVRIGAARVQPFHSVGQIAGRGSLDDLARSLAAERRFARQNHAQEAAQGEHVRAGVGCFPAGLLRGHVSRRAQHLSRAGPFVRRFIRRAVVNSLVGVRAGAGTGL
ncbi:MAG TPA: hypothetical protein VKD71_02170 [Gemmataceae bacterium]|nr:hypothetical protein [Gemmataceae bacterium]